MKGRLLACVLVLSLVGAGVAGADASGEPAMRVSLAERTVEAGETTTLELTVANEGDLEWASATNPAFTQRVTTARAVSVSLRSGDTPLTVETADRLLGSVPEGGSAGVPFRVRVDPDAEPGTYRLPVVLEYAYDDYVADTGFVDDETGYLRTTVRVRVREAPRFAVVSAGTDARAGESGDVTLTLENVGTATARNASVALTSPNADVQFGPGGATRGERFVGAWAPGERRTLTYGVQTAPATTRQTYALDAQVRYRDPEGRQRQSESLTTGVAPEPTPTFAFRDVSTDLRVGERGAVTGTVVNDGESTARNVVVRLDPETPGVTPVVAERPVGDLEPGESAEFSLPVDVAKGVSAGERRLALTAGYDAERGPPRVSDPATVRATIVEERDPFRVRVVNGTTAPDVDGYRFVVEVTNVGDVPRSDVVLALRTGPPITTPTPTATRAKLAPGQTARIAFSLSVDEDAVEGSYPLWLNVTADTPDRDAVTDGPYLLSLGVREEQAGPTDFNVLAIAGFVAVVLLGGIWWWLRG
ncbi:MAG: COG1361 S-layer family protein [Haloferacaceae archaeon]